MKVRKIARALKQVALALAVTGAVMFATSSCSLSDLFSSMLSGLGLSSLLSSLSSTTSA